MEFIATDENVVKSSSHNIFSVWSNETAYYAVTNSTVDVNCVYPGTC